MTRAQHILSQIDEDMIADMMKQMDDFAASTGGYINRTGGRLDRSNDETDEEFYMKKGKGFHTRKGGTKKPRKS